MRTSIRPTIAEVSLGAIRRNVSRVKAVVGDVPVWAVIKADAYGHGAVTVARALAGRTAGLAVSLVEEGLELRAAGIDAPIAVLGAYYDRCHAQVVDENLMPVVYDPSDLDRFSAVAASRRRVVGVHLKVDTGMNRLGIHPSELPAVLARAAVLTGVRIAGLCTHFPSADAVAEDDTRSALARFLACVSEAERRGLGPLVNHAANSAAAVRFPAARLGAVRPGLALYGAMPSAAVALAGLEPALRLSTRIMAIHAGILSQNGVGLSARRTFRPRQSGRHVIAILRVLVVQCAAGIERARRHQKTRRDSLRRGNFVGKNRRAIATSGILALGISSSGKQRDRRETDCTSTDEFLHRCGFRAKGCAARLIAWSPRALARGK